MFIVGILIIPQLQANNWELKQKLTPNDKLRGGMGFASKLAANGQTLIAGAPFSNHNFGSAYVFQKQSDGNWQQDGPSLTITDHQGTQIFFGGTTSISDDGSRIAIGGWGDNNETGAVWIFERQDNTKQPTWRQTGPKLVGYNSIGHAHQGGSIALSGDGKKIAIGAWADDTNRGAVWVYQYNESQWQEGPKITNQDLSAQAQFGSSLALSYSGEILAVGADSDDNNKGAVLMYKCLGTICTQQGKKLVGSDAEGSAQQGTSVTLSGDGKTVAFGGDADQSNIGASWVYIYTGKWIQQGKKLIGSDYVDLSNQGYSISLSRDGNVLLVGGFGDNVYTGAAWRFIRKDESQWVQDGEKITNPYAYNSLQASSVSLSSEGGTAAIGSQRDENYLGAVLIYGPKDSSSRETYMTYWLPPLLAIAAGIITFGLKYMIKKHCCRTDDSALPTHIKLSDPLVMIETNHRGSFA